MGQPVVHFEIGFRDAVKSESFYKELFGWETSAYGPSRMVDTKAEGGIRGHLNQLGHEPHNYTLIYVQVDDLQAALDHAAKLGGKTVVPPTDIPGMGAFAWLADPEGNTVGLWKAAAK